MNKQQLILDTTALSESDNVGAYLRSADGTLLTHTDVGGKKSLDVNVANSVTVTATNLDIRDLAFATDKVDVSGSVVALDAPTLAALENITVSATDLDIRNLDYSLDNVAIKGSTGNQLVVNADGSINVLADISLVSGSDKAEDAAHASGDIGTYVLAVRQDTLASSVSADGDYGSFKLNSLGALYVEVAKSAVPTHSAWKTSQNTVNATAELIVAADLSNRKKIFIQNNSNGSNSLYLGDLNTVTSADGIRLPAGASMELEIAAGVAIYGISTAAGADIRVAEFA
jgi:hypothetical protein